MNSENKNNFYISLGVWLLIVPLLGIPNIWRGRLVELTGVLLIAYAAWPVLVKKVSQRPRVKKDKAPIAQLPTEKVDPLIPEINPEEKNEME